MRSNDNHTVASFSRFGIVAGDFRLSSPYFIAFGVLLLESL
ncbi:9443_t:CDS:2 [Dentiscutata erythropus]|uniref:9443_t:CDS:1 n=1 Tax=Dentiscutata erythropus TaxID=1348616 RepID=A0A9N9F348_9GLOM|nr:9443_t:CDS:2 [Dentiscutata erythropus]